MSGSQQRLHRRLLQVVDGCLLAILFRLCHAIRYRMNEWEGMPPIATFDQFFWMVAIIVPLTPFVLEMQGFYRDPLRRSRRELLKQFANTLLWVGLMVGSCVVFLKYLPQSRAVLLMFMMSSGLVLMVRDWAFSSILRARIRAGQLLRRVVLAGGKADIEALLQRLPEQEREAMEIVARLDLDHEPVSQLPQLFKEHSVEQVILAAEHLHFCKVEEAVRACETEGVEAWLSTEFLNTVSARPTFDAMGDQPMLVFRRTPDQDWRTLAKEVMDRAGAAVLLVLTAPLWIVASVGICITSPGPILFRQERGGRYGKPFRMFKFRTMCTDADSPEMRRKVAAFNELDGPAFKLANDPRIFAFGAFLRRTSIDELPQLLNVLMGEMSLVGPRPLPVYQVECIAESHQRRRLSVKPGLTCLWQISGRNRITDFEDWVELDLDYIDNWSLWLDLKIMLRTIPAVLAGSGAK